MTLARLVSFPALCFEVRTHAHLIGPGPPCGLNPKCMFQNFSDGDVDQWNCSLDLLIFPVVVAGIAMVDASSFTDEPAIDKVVPRVGLIPLILFGLRKRNQLWFFEPPDGPFTITSDGFGP